MYVYYVGIIAYYMWKKRGLNIRIHQMTEIAQKNHKL